jgi:hypothetical protein
MNVKSERKRKEKLVYKKYKKERRVTESIL